MKLLSIAIPAYNVEKYLKDAIAPYLVLDAKGSLEVLIINDGSKDSTLQLAKQYEEQYPEMIRVIDKENGGHGSAVNAGIVHARGKYFKVVDGDDWVDAEVLDKVLKELVSLNVDMIATGYTVIYEETGQKEEVHISKVEYGKEYRFLDICENIEHIGMHSIIYRTKILQENQVRLDEHCFYVDVEYDLFPLKWVDTVIFYDDLLYQYRVGRPGQSVSMQSMIKNRNNHDRVIRRIMEWAEKENLLEPIRHYAEKRLEGMIDVQYLVLFNAGTGKKERKELVRYDTWLRKSNRSLYDSVTQRKVLFMRKTGFWSYYFVKLLYKLSGKKIEYIK